MLVLLGVQPENPENRENRFSQSNFPSFRAKNVPHALHLKNVREAQMEVRPSSALVPIGTLLYGEKGY